MAGGSSDAPFKKRVARRLAAVRQRLGISQEALAERLGIDVRNVQLAEAGSNLQVETIESYATAFGMRAEALLAQLSIEDAAVSPAEYEAADPTPLLSVAEPKPRGPRIP